MNPNFAAMTRQQLRAYVLAHRDDDEAFQAYVDRSDIEAQWVDMPPVQSVIDLQQIPEFLHRLHEASSQVCATSDDHNSGHDADLSRATSLDNLARLYVSQGHYEQAEPLYARCLEIFLQVLGQDHPSTQMVLNNFVTCLQAAVAAGQAGALSAHPLTQALLAQLATDE